MVLDPAAITFYRELLTRHFASWQASTGNQPQSKQTLVSFLAAINTNEEFWRELSAGQAKHHLTCDLARLRSTLAALDFSDADKITTKLQTLDLPEDEFIMIGELMLAGLPREERIRQAFAAKDPAAIARALERIADPEHAQADVSRLEAWLYKDICVWPENTAGKLTAAGLLLGMLLAAYYVGCATNSNNSSESLDRQAAISTTTLYKGVTPDLHG